MDGWFNIFPHTNTQLTRARGSHKGNCLRRQVGRTLTGGGGRAESTTMRCDANETCWGNTVLCILRCAFWNRNRFIHILDFLFLFFSAGFPFPVLRVFLSRFGQVKKEREQASHAFIIIIIIIIPERGWGGAERAWSNLCLFLVIWGKYRGLFPPLCEPVSFIPALMLCFYTYDT